MPKTKYKALKYLRLSRADEKGKKKAADSDSIENQRKLLDRYIAEHPDIQDMGEKVDDGWSGILFDRPAFNEMMDAVRDGSINCIIVKDMSRFGREYNETGRYLRRVLPTYGVRFIAIQDNIDTASTRIEDDMAVPFRGVLNDAYCMDISTKTRSALNAKRNNGEYTGAFTVYGYRKSKENKNRLAPDEYPAGIVREIFKRRVEGHSALRIADDLNSQGVLSPLEYKKAQGIPCAKGEFGHGGSAKWSATTVNRILQDETYTGTLVQCKQGTESYKNREIQYKPSEEWLRTPNAHEAIVQKAEFDLVQRLMLMDSRAAVGGKEVHLFSGLLVCGCCGGRMTRKSVPYKGQHYYYYYCPTGKKNGCHTPVMLKEEQLSSSVLKSVKTHIASLVTAQDVARNAAAQSRQAQDVRQLQAKIEENRQRYAKAKDYRAGLYQFLLDGHISKAECKELKQEYADTMQEAQDSIQALQMEIQEKMNGGQESAQWLERVETIASMDSLDRKTLVHLVQSIRVCGKKQLEITYAYKPEFAQATAVRREVA